MTNERSKHTLDEVQAHVRADHARIRAKLDDVARAAGKDADGAEAGASKELTDAIWELFLIFDAHLAMEERDLVPLLVETGVWGPVPVERLHDEHRQQRTVLLAMVEECDAETRGSAVIADDARWLVASLRRDMDHEERVLEAIRDDGFVADQFTG
jgi:DUF438 domain-containing protein